MKSTKVITFACCSVLLAFVGSMSADDNKAGADTDQLVTATELLDKLRQNPKPKPKLKKRGVAIPKTNAEMRVAETAAEKFKRRGAAPISRGVRVEYFGERARVSVKVDPEAMVTFNNLLFDLDSADLNFDSTKQIEQIAIALRKLPDVKFLLEGHTCDLGNERHNLDLSERRAEMVRRHLIRDGVEPDQLISLGFGETDPVVENNSEENRAKNRRVVIYRRTE